MSTHQFTGVIDRFEDDLAVILLEACGEVIDEVVLDRAELPADGAETNAVLTVTLTSDGEVAALEYEPGETTGRKEKAQSRFDRLAERQPKDDEQ
ncbi:DUF3006 domain-containing protein [Halolamina litorea]|uniref:DUF3006 domain-containing protein n=1 Tax=Halolamina litorea TaxID=1515593 RepID=A0ABD6BVU7_9EURY|nr:DUF3006 domain-containing protein [Halolamina litorea]